MDKDIDTAQKRVTIHKFETSTGQFAQVWVDRDVVGGYKILPDGFLPFGKRKPRATEAEAQYVIVLDAAMRKLKEGASLMEALRELRDDESAQ